MKHIPTFAACMCFAMPCYADRIGEPVIVPIEVTVDSIVMCTEAGYCGDVEMIAVEE